jgi:hypothetical protein
MRLVLERRAETPLLLKLGSPLLAVALTLVSALAISSTSGQWVPRGNCIRHDDA